MKILLIRFTHFVLFCDKKKIVVYVSAVDNAACRLQKRRLFDHEFEHEYVGVIE